MKKIYRLKDYDKVKNHHFIDKETWDKLTSYPELDVEFPGGMFKDTAIITPLGKKHSIDDSYMVDVGDLYEVKASKPEPKATVKTYTKDEIRDAGIRVMMDSNLDENSAIASALAIAKLINRL